MGSDPAEAGANYSPGPRAGPTITYSWHAPFPPGNGWVSTPSCFASRSATPSHFGGKYTAVWGYVKLFARATFLIV